MYCKWFWLLYNIRLIFNFLHVKHGGWPLKVWPLTWKVLPFPLQDRSSWPQLVSSAQHLLVLGWAAGLGGPRSPKIVHTEWEEKVNKEMEETECVMKERERNRRGKRLLSGSKWPVLWVRNSGHWTTNIPHLHLHRRLKTRPLSPL